MAEFNPDFQRGKTEFIRDLGRLSPFTSRVRGFLITAMLKLGAWIISPLLLMPLRAQEVLPDDTAVPPPVDTITPVPALEFSTGFPGIAPMAMPKNLNISNYGGGTIEGVKDVGVRYKGPGIKITGDNGMEAFADSAVVDFKAQSVTLEGNVSIYQGNILQRGDRAVYFYEKKTFDASGLRASLDPILLEANRFSDETRDGKKVFVGENAGITTDDSEDPGFLGPGEENDGFPGRQDRLQRPAGLCRRRPGFLASLSEPAARQRARLPFPARCPLQLGPLPAQHLRHDAGRKIPTRRPAKTRTPGCFPAGTSTSAPSAAWAWASISWTRGWRTSTKPPA